MSANEKLPPTFELDQREYENGQCDFLREYWRGLLQIPGVSLSQWVKILSLDEASVKVPPMNNDFDHFFPTAYIPIPMAGKVTVAMLKRKTVL